MAELSCVQQVKTGGSVMNVIVIGQFKRATDWMVGEIQLQPEVQQAVGVNTAAEYLEAARELVDFSAVIGHYKLLDYKGAEAELAQENIFPLRRIIASAAMSTQLLEWASEQFYDGVIDLTDFRNTFAVEVMDLLTVEKGHGHASMSFPLTTNVPAYIPYRDDIDVAIVRMISYGFSNQEIAANIFLSVQTVRNRISRLLEGSGARNRTHLCTMFLLPYTSYQNGEVLPILTIESDPLVEKADLSASNE
jgi:hypothetical protein